MLQAFRKSVPSREKKFRLDQYFGQALISCPKLSRCMIRAWYAILPSTNEERSAPSCMNLPRRLSLGTMTVDTGFRKNPISSSALRSHASIDVKTVWILEAIGQAMSESLTVVHPVPFSIGRKAGCSLQLQSRTVSSHHADLTVRDSSLLLIDRQSTNFQRRMMWVSMRQGTTPSQRHAHI